MPARAPVPFEGVALVLAMSAMIVSGSLRKRTVCSFQCVIYEAENLCLSDFPIADRTTKYADLKIRRTSFWCQRNGLPNVATELSVARFSQGSVPH